MNLVRVRFLLAVVVASMTAGQLKAQVTLQTTGTTTGSAATVEFDTPMQAGKKLAVTNFVLALTINGMVIDPKTLALGQGNMGYSGSARATIALPAGKYKVYIKVLLQDGTMPTDTRDVTFQKILCPPPCPCPVPCFSPEAAEVASPQATMEELTSQVLQWNAARVRLYGLFGNRLL